MKKILVFTDSRGQHKPAGSSHNVFAERLEREVLGVSVDLVLCPMKWTTTLDFFEYIGKFDISTYDWIILYTGIVEWSPRTQKNAIDDLYNNIYTAHLDNWNSNTRDYSQKIVNNKKFIFDKTFGEKQILKYLNTPFEIKYEGQPTINMYSLQMAEEFIGPILKGFNNLIFINSNRFLSDWDGDYKRGRPENISITHEYSNIISSFIPKDRLVDLRVWDDSSIQLYTCDNLHLTKLGSDWIFNDLVKKMSLSLKSEWEINKSEFERNITHSDETLLKFDKLERFSLGKSKNFLASYNIDDCLATLIIGVRLDDQDPSRLKNLSFLLDWIEYYYDGLFDVLIVEQDKASKISSDYILKYGIRHEFLYNPEDYNRGWGYNVAVEHFCNDSKVVVLMDTDVLTGNNFVSEVRDCFVGKYNIISPYQNIYYSDEEEANKIIESKTFLHLKNRENIKNPVTITGGIVIFDRKTYLELKGFEQYIGYGCEDRSLDVMALGLCDNNKIRIAPKAYVHLHHPTDKGARKNFNDIYNHLKDNYKCEWSPKLRKTDFIHSHCEHVPKENLVSLLIKKFDDFADRDLYKNKIAPLTANGHNRKGANIPDSLILPPDFENFHDYQLKEIYKAPDADCSELEQFRNAFVGQRCFIIGNGPSLNKHDLGQLKNEYTFGVNSFYYKTRESGFRPTFYVVEDSSVMKENLKEIKDYHAPFKFFPTVYKRLHPKTPNTFFFKMNRGFYEKSSPNYCVPRFSTDATKELYCGQSVTYINLQLAYFMGFTEVYLIGMDFSYVIPDTHKRTGDVLLSDTDDENHFHKDYFGKGKTWKDPKLERVGMNYRMAKLAYESTGRRIYNATVGGSLEIFERKCYDSIFDNTNKTEVLDDVCLSFPEVNKLYQQKRYTDATVGYLKLAEQNSRNSLYKRALLDSYFKSIDNKQPVLDEVKERIKKVSF